MYACSHETGRGFFEGVRGKEIGLSLFATLLHTLVIRGAGAPSAFPDRTVVEGYPPEHETTYLCASP